MIDPINIAAKLAQIDDHWNPRIVGEVNGQYVMLVKVRGEFVWHHHALEDELFQVLQGTLFIDFADHTATVRAGEIIIVPRGVEHRPRTNGEEVHVLLFEQKSVQHTGNVQHERTVKEFKRL